MAKKKISGLPASGALTGTEIVPIVQSGTTKQTTTQAIADLVGGGEISGSGTTNFVSKWSDGTTLTDSLFYSDANVAKTIFGGVDKGLYIDFANNVYLFGNRDNVPNQLYIGGNELTLGDAFNNVNSTKFIVDDSVQIIKTSNQGADTGLYIDFTPYTDGQTTSNIKINGSYQQFPNANGRVDNYDNSFFFRNHNFYSYDNLSTLQFGQYYADNTDSGGMFKLNIDKGAFGDAIHEFYINAEEGFTANIYGGVVLNSKSEDNLRNNYLLLGDGYGSLNFNDNDLENNISLEFDLPTQIIKTKSNSVNKGLYIDFANGIYGLGFTETGDWVLESAIGVKLTANNITIGDNSGYVSYIDINFSQLRTYLQTDRVKYRNLTTTEINGLTATALEGDVVYNVTLHVLCFYDGSGWKKVSHTAM
jgi:hypothetical protein